VTSVCMLACSRQLSTTWGQLCGSLWSSSALPVDGCGPRAGSDSPRHRSHSFVNALSTVHPRGNWAPDQRFRCLSPVSTGATETMREVIG
jgi:hypothetical protein